VAVAHRVGDGRRPGQRAAEVPQLQHVRRGRADLAEQHGDRVLVPTGEHGAAAAHRLRVGGVAVDRAELDNGQRTHGVRQRLRHRAQRRDQPLGLARGPHVRHPQVCDEPAAQGRGHRVDVGEGDEGDREAQLVGGGGGAPAERGEQLGGRRAGQVEVAAVQGVGGDEVELHLGDDAEAATAAAEGPEQLGSVSALTSRSSPSGVTSRIRRTRSAAQPCRRPSGLRPPPSE
jgi:hypothetical protein